MTADWTTAEGVHDICKGLCCCGWISCASYEELFHLRASGVAFEDPRWKPLVREMKSVVDEMFSASVRLYGSAVALISSADSKGDFKCARGPFYLQNQETITHEQAKLITAQPQ